MGIDRHPTEGKPQPGAALTSRATLTSPSKWLEYPFDLIGGYAWAGIGNLDNRLLAAVRMRLTPDA
jgi:hypothetical protein